MMFECGSPGAVVHRLPTLSNSGCRNPARNLLVDLVLALGRPRGRGNAAEVRFYIGNGGVPVDGFPQFLSRVEMRRPFRRNADLPAGLWIPTNSGPPMIQRKAAEATDL